VREAAFANSVPPAFEETNWALNELSRQFKFAIISNIDDHLILQTVRQFDVRFHKIITSEQSRCYKAEIGIFQEAVRQLGEKASHVVHIAEGLCEAEPISRLGVKSICVRRPARSDDGSKADPDATVSSLAEIVGALS
jgi:FMN phosphatase YigB (HAD superfamily)